MNSINLFKTFSKISGFRIKYLFFLFFRSFYVAFIKISFFFDKLFFHSYRETKIEKPIFILGHPRSGTSFLHRYIAEHFKETKGLKLNELIIPSIFARNILKPVFNRIKHRKSKSLYDSSIHKTGLFMEETDDAAIFFRYFDGLFFWLLVNAWKSFKSEDELITDLKNAVSKPKFLNFRKSLFQKHLYKHSGRLLNKSFSLFFQIPELQKVFPCCKLVILIRDPLEAIPSSFSLEEHIQNKVNGFSGLSEEKKIHYFENLYIASKFFYKELDRQIDLVAKDTIFIITHKELKNNFEDCMLRLSEFCELKIDENIRNEFKKQSALQITQCSNHKYSLEKYGLNPKQILEDFDFIYKKYDLRC